MQDIENLDKSAKYLIFAGISNPINFFNLLKNNNINIVKRIFYADHYIYNEEDIEKIKKISVNESLNDTPWNGPLTNATLNVNYIEIGAQCSGNGEIPGCTDSDAFNYDSTATDNDGSCVAVVEGCMDAQAVNYNELVNTDNGSCCFIGGCERLNQTF